MKTAKALPLLGLAAALGCAPASPTPKPRPTAPALVTLPLTPLPKAPPPTATVEEAPSPPAEQTLAPLPEVELAVALAIEGTLRERAAPCATSVGFHNLGSKLVYQIELRYAELDGHRFVQRPEFTRGLPTRGFTPWIFFGDWPASAWVQLRDDASCPNDETFSGALYRWDKSRWRHVKATELEKRYEPWYPGDGSIGAIVHNHVYRVSLDTVVNSLDPRHNPPAPRLARRTSGEQRLAVHASLSLPSGHLFVFGTDLEDNVRRDILCVERFEPGQEVASLDVLPQPRHPYRRIEWWSMAARSPSDVYVAGVVGDPPEHFDPSTSYLAHFDGKTWRLLDVPQGLWAPEIAVARDGTLWVLSDTPLYNPSPPETWTWQLLRRSPGGEWAQIRLRTPTGLLGSDMILSDVTMYGDALWIEGFPDEHRDQLYVWTTQSIDAVLKIKP